MATPAKYTGKKSSTDLTNSTEIVLKSAKEDPAIIDALCVLSSCEQPPKDFFRRLNRDFFNRLLYLGHFFKRKVHVQCDSASCMDCSKNRQGLLSVLSLLGKIWSDSRVRVRFLNKKDFDDIEKSFTLANTCLWLDEPSIILAALDLIEENRCRPDAYLDLLVDEWNDSFKIALAIKKQMLHQSRDVLKKSSFLFELETSSDMDPDDSEYVSEEYVGASLGHFFSSEEDLEVVLPHLQCVASVSPILLWRSDVVPYLLYFIRNSPADIREACLDILFVLISRLHDKYPPFVRGKNFSLDKYLSEIVSIINFCFENVYTFRREFLILVQMVSYYICKEIRDFTPKCDGIPTYTQEHFQLVLSIRRTAQKYSRSDGLYIHSWHKLTSILNEILDS